MLGSDDPLFADDGAVGVGDGDGDVTGTEEAYTLRCEAAAQRSLDALDRADRAGAAAPEGAGGDDATPRLSRGYATAAGGEGRVDKKLGIS